MRTACTATLAALLVVSVANAAESEPRAVKYDDLTKLVRDNQGKVIIVSAWHHL